MEALRFLLEVIIGKIKVPNHKSKRRRRWRWSRVSVISFAILAKLTIATWFLIIFLCISIVCTLVRFFNYALLFEKKKKRKKKWSLFDLASNRLLVRSPECLWKIDIISLLDNLTYSLSNNLKIKDHVWKQLNIIFNALCFFYLFSYRNCLVC